MPEFSAPNPGITPITFLSALIFTVRTAILKMNEDPSTQATAEPRSHEGMLIGGVNVLENLDLAKKTTLFCHLDRTVLLRRFDLPRGQGSPCSFPAERTAV
jgi:hypothetical protein